MRLLRVNDYNGRLEVRDPALLQQKMSRQCLCDMKLAKSTLLVWLLVSAMAGFLHLTATGCKKAAAPKPIQSTLSPEQAKEQRLTWNLKTLVEAYEKAGHKIGRAHV